MLTTASWHGMGAQALVFVTNESFVDVTAWLSSSTTSNSTTTGLYDIWSPLPGLNPTDHVAFGTSLALSSDGTRLLTGTPFYDYQEYSQPNPQGGGVFFYHLVLDSNNNNSNSHNNHSNNNDTGTDAQWQLLWSIYGAANQGIGNFISLSPSGQLAAIHFGTHVQVYTTYNGQVLGDAIFDVDCPGTTASYIQLGDQYLAVSCISYQNYQGKVNVYELSNDGKSWESVLVLVPGSDIEAQSRFGWRMALDDTATSGNRRFRMAVTAPNHLSNTGLLRVYDVFEDGTYTQVGSDLTGESPGEQLGFDLSLSETSDSILAVGVPQCAGGGTFRGCTRVYSYQRTLFNGASWVLMAALNGTADADRSGRNVAISLDGTRVVTATFRHDQFRGQVQVYDRVDQQYFELVASLIGETPLERWGSDIAISGTGSVLAASSTFKHNGAGDPVGSIRVLIGDTPYCSLPLSTGGNGLSLEQHHCRNKGALVTSQQDCVALVIAGMPCEWIDPTSMIFSATATAPPSDVANATDSTFSTAPTHLIHTEPPTMAPVAAISLVGCPCDQNGQCLARSLRMGEALFLCVSGIQPYLDLLKVTSFYLEEGTRRVDVIDQKGVHVPNATSACSGKVCTLQTPVDSVFFSKNGPNRLNATGTLMIVAASSGRNVRGTARRHLQSVQGRFSVQVGLDNSDAPMTTAGVKVTQHSAHPGLVVALVALALFVVLCAWFSCRSARRERSFQ